jgi:AraC-like DNA-binding protein
MDTLEISFLINMVEIFNNIRKLYRFETPCEELVDYIEFFSETSLDATRQYVGTNAFTVELFPSYTPTIWINLGSSYQLKNGNRWYYIDKDKDVLLLRSEIVERRNLPTDNIFTVKFNPGGFEAVFGMEQEKIGCNIIYLDELVAPSIIRKLKKLDCFNSRVIFIQRYFLDLLNSKFGESYLYNRVMETVSRYIHSGMSFQNNKLAAEMALTDKTLYRYFKHLVGASPKEYFSTIRARTALTAYVTDRESFSAYDFGYYDNSHFYREVVKFTGRKLSSYCPE